MALNPVPMSAPGYPRELTDPMRAEMVAMGAKELKTPAEVDQALKSTPGTTLVIVNSVCGCAAGHCRPGVSLALKKAQIHPDHVVTVFAGVDRDATNQARSYFHGFKPSSPQVALMKDGEVVAMLERHHIESSNADLLADYLVNQFRTHCAK
ncbi:MAG TPA: BrxA/BrxB family bacilliredoxin [Planctomycetota bacterium]|nr:BrxA/BrxB family bacilliredoxin [Planctomycetota bacterium]